MGQFEDFMALTHLDADQRKKLWMLIKAQYASNSETYHDQWRPLIEAHPTLFDAPVGTVYDLKELKQAIKLLPERATWGLSVQRRPSDKTLRTNALFARVSALDLTHVKKIDDALLMALGESTHMTSLRRLDLGRTDYGSVTHKGLKALAKSPHLSSLERLRLHNVHVENKGIDALLGQSTYQLVRLEVTAGGVKDKGLERIAASKHMETLRVLRLGSNQIGDKGVLALASSPYVGQLRELSMWGNDIGDRGILALSRHLGTELDVIELNQNSMGDDAVEALVASEAMRGVKEFNLAYNDVTDKGAIAIAESEHLGELEYLSLAFTRVSDTGALALLQSEKLGALQKLTIWGNRISDDVMHALKNSRIHVR